MNYDHNMNFKSGALNAIKVVFTKTEKGNYDHGKVSVQYNPKANSNETQTRKSDFTSRQKRASNNPPSAKKGSIVAKRNTQTNIVIQGQPVSTGQKRASNPQQSPKRSSIVSKRNTVDTQAQYPESPQPLMNNRTSIVQIGTDVGTQVQTRSRKQKGGKSNGKRLTNQSSERLTRRTNPSIFSTHALQDVKPKSDVQCDAAHDGRLFMWTKLPFNVDVLFNLLFSKSKFITEFHEMRGTKNLNIDIWKANKDGQQTRILSMTVALQANVGPKTSNVTEIQCMRKCSERGVIYSIDSVSKNEGVPYADVFNIKTHFCFKRVDAETTEIEVFADVEFIKPTWAVVKAFIMKHSIEGLSEFYQSLQNELLQKATKMG